MLRAPQLLLACLFAFPSMAQTVVTKKDLPYTTPSDGTVTYVSSEAIPIHPGEGIPPELQVPKVAITQQVEQAGGANMRPAPIHISVDAVPIGPGTTPIPSIKEMIGGDGSSSGPGGTIILPPMPAIHVGTRGLPPSLELPSE